MKKIVLAILIPISFICFVGGMMLGIYFHPVGFFIMLCGVVLTLIASQEFGKLLKEKRESKAKLEVK